MKNSMVFDALALASPSEVPEADRRCRAEGPGQREVCGAEKHGAGWELGLLELANENKTGYT